MSPSSRRSVLQAVATSGACLVAGCSSLDLGSEPPVDVNVLNYTSAEITLNIRAIDEDESDEEILFQKSFDLEAYQSDDEMKGYNANRQDAFRASAASIYCSVDGKDKQFDFEASCGDSDSDIDDGFTVEWREGDDHKKKFVFRQSDC
jgi:hypothetical protein